MLFVALYILSTSWLHSGHFSLSLAFPNGKLRIISPCFEQK
jgi:hypothetical protein